jgi:hypothetical protein
MARLAESEENEATVDHAVAEAIGRKESSADKSVGQQDVVVLASGNLGLIYLMEEPRRLTLEEINERHPDLIDALRRHPYIGFVMVRSRDRGPVVLGATGVRYLDEPAGGQDDPLAVFSGHAAAHLQRTDGFTNAPDILVNSFYDPELEQGCAFEELISFHGGLGGPQTRPFILHPTELQMPAERVLGAAALHDVLVGWRRELQGDPTGLAVAASRSAQPR